jgi:biopolymer transport protein ExbD
MRGKLALLAMLVPLAAILTLMGAPQLAPAPAPAESAKLEPAADPAKDFIIKAPGVIIDTKAKEVRLEAVVCLQKGALELIGCGAGTKEHESIFSLKAKPSDVAVALAVLGLQPGQPGYVTDGGAFSPPAGSVVDVLARFTPPEGKPQEVPVWKMLRPAGAQSGLERPLQWVYVGRPEKEALAGANSEGTLICLANFPYAILDVPFESTDDNRKLSFEANPAVIPPVGTLVEIVLRPTAEKVSPMKVDIEIVIRKGKPVILDGNEVTMEQLREKLNRLPPEIQNAVLRADPEETFGRVLEVHDLLREALIKTKMLPLRPPAEVSVTADGKVHLGAETLTVDEFQKKSESLLRGAPHIDVIVDPKAPPRTVNDVMAIARSFTTHVNLKRAEVPAGEKKP